jgi:hypothetical protein
MLLLLHGVNTPQYVYGLVSVVILKVLSFWQYDIPKSLPSLESLVENNIKK